MLSTFPLEWTFGPHVACCLYMTGVIWVVQALYYPAFTVIDDAGFVAFHGRHTRGMTYVVGPVMCLELATALALAARAGWWIANAISVVALFASTFLLSVPLHNRLARGRDATLIVKLTRTNWPRTALWTIRALAFTLVLMGITL